MATAGSVAPAIRVVSVAAPAPHTRVEIGAPQVAPPRADDSGPLDAQLQPHELDAVFDELYPEEPIAEGPRPKPKAQEWVEFSGLIESATSRYGDDLPADARAKIVDLTRQQWFAGVTSIASAARAPPSGAGGPALAPAPGGAIVDQSQDGVRRGVGNSSARQVSWFDRGGRGGGGRKGNAKRDRD